MHTMVNTDDMGWVLFLDDERMPASLDDNIFIARDVEGAINLVKQHGIGPSFISFDHDLGGDETAMDFVNWLIDMDVGSVFTLIPKCFQFTVHSQNPVGKANIEGKLNSYLKFRKQNGLT